MASGHFADHPFCPRRELHIVCGNLYLAYTDGGDVLPGKRFHQWSGSPRERQFLPGTCLSRGSPNKWPDQNEYGALLPSGEKGIAIRFKFLSDEIFGSDHPVLVTVEPQSIYILQLQLVESRDKESWRICWLEIVDNDTDKVGGIAADQGSRLVGGIEKVFSKLLYQSDLFHVITSLAHLLWRFEKRVYAAIAKTDETGGKFERARSETTLEKRLAAYESAQAETEDVILLYENFPYLFRQLQQILEMIDLQSAELRNKSAVLSQIEVILSLMEELNHSKISEAVSSFRRHQEDLLRYFDPVRGQLKQNRLKLIRFYLNHKVFTRGKRA